MPVRNRDAEMAFEMAVKLISNGLPVAEETREKLWTACHSNQSLLNAVALYRACNSDYSDKALVKLHRELMKVVTE